ncbi:hypothetical protein [Companilactobacillus jidongensis]|uniref:hypothetical protein n=1 Tax=Companilactobacillus jidongensis TaxID=2486006 RepID=UPI000F7B3DBD|nr:hypothetical protein [Companilactobacillus jidongensis]
MEQPSEPESQIIGILNNEQIVFDRERTFPGLISKTENVLLPVDFALNINGFLAIIEYNGAQHYKAKNNTAGSQSAFRRLCANGTARLDFCNKNNIPLLIIHYKDKNRLTKIINFFIQDVKNNLHGSTKSYTAHTKGYFKNIPYYTFGDTPTGPIKPVQIHENDSLGYLSLSNDAIVWTKKELDTLLSRIDSYESKIQQYKSVTADLVLTIDSLQNELTRKDELLAENKNHKLEPKIDKSIEKKPATYELVNKSNLIEPYKFTGKFRMHNSPRSRLTSDARIFIKTLSNDHGSAVEIQDYLKNTYHESISLPTLKKCLL